MNVFLLDIRCQHMEKICNFGACFTIGICPPPSMLTYPKGRVRLTDRMNFRKSSKRLLTPPPHFRKVTLRFSRQNCDKSAYVHMEEHLCILWSYFPWDACSTNVQHGNRVKTYPKRPFCITFMLKKPCLKVQILQYKFLYWEWPPSPLRNFSIQAYRHTGVHFNEGSPDNEYNQ